MPIVKLARVNLKDSVGDLGDRYNSGISSSAISNDEWHLEANYHFGTLGDVCMYRNANVNTKNAPPLWKWYGGIPTANIKSYSLAEPPPPSALGHEQASHSSTASESGTAQKR